MFRHHVWKQLGFHQTQANFGRPTFNAWLLFAAQRLACHASCNHDAQVTLDPNCSIWFHPSQHFFNWINYLNLHNCYLNYQTNSIVCRARMEFACSATKFITHRLSDATFFAPWINKFSSYIVTCENWHCFLMRSHSCTTVKPDVVFCAI